MARLYTNENCPLPAIEELRKRGHDVLTTGESGKAGQRIPDDAVLEFAVSERRILITLNRKHFVRLHSLKSGHSGIIVCSFDRDFEALAERIHEALERGEDIKGKLIRVNRLHQ